jgi:hypothetical protein
MSTADNRLVDRLINAALTKAADAVVRILATSFPMDEAERMAGANRLAQAEERVESWEPAAIGDWPSLAEWDRELREGFLAPKRATAPATPPAVEDVAPPAGVGALAGATHADTGGHPREHPTSDLLYMAADVIGPQIKSMPEVALVFELRDRAAVFAAHGD